MRALTLLFAAALVSFLATAAADDPPAKPKPAASPEEALQRLEAAIRQGDYDAYLAVLPKPNREHLQKTNAAIRANEEAVNALNDEVEARFKTRLSPKQASDFGAQI